MSDQLGEIVGRSLKEIQQLIPPIRSINTMQSGISCQKLVGPMLGRYLVIAISVPYFDIGMIPDRLVESLTVSEYSRLGMGLLPIRDTDGERKQGVLVHQAWFLVFNNGLSTACVLLPCVVLIYYVRYDSDVPVCRRQASSIYDGRGTAVTDTILPEKIRGVQHGCRYDRERLHCITKTVPRVLTPGSQTGLFPSLPWELQY